jgi:hypothetical protein
VCRRAPVATSAAARRALRFGDRCRQSECHGECRREQVQRFHLGHLVRAGDRIEIGCRRRQNRLLDRPWAVAIRKM